MLRLRPELASAKRYGPSFADSSHSPGHKHKTAPEAAPAYLNLEHARLLHTSPTPARVK